MIYYYSNVFSMFDIIAGDKPEEIYLEVFFCFLHMICSQKYYP